MMLFQTEYLLLIGLGFGLGLLVCMTFGFSIWAAANRWQDRKRRLAIPSTILDLQAERSALRAENAMVRSRYEMLLEDARNTGAEHEAEVMRHRNRALQTTSKLSENEAEIQKLRKLVDKLAAETKARGQRLAELTEAASHRPEEAPPPVPSNVVTLPLSPASAERASAHPLRISARVAQLQAVADELTAEHMAQAAAASATESNGASPAEEGNSAPQPGADSTPEGDAADSGLTRLKKLASHLTTPSKTGE